MNTPHYNGGYDQTTTTPTNGCAPQCATSQPTPAPDPPALTAPAETPAIEAPKEQQ